MSGLHGVGHHHHIQETQGVTPTAPTQGATGTQAASSTGSDPLEALQGLMKQLQTSANTRAIPAHQNW